MHDPTDNPPIIDPARPRTVLRKQWIDHRHCASPNQNSFAIVKLPAELESDF
jgi:hypothetical protein